MKTSILEYVQDEINEQQKDIDKANAKLTENYCYNFEWDYPAALYSSHYIKNYMGILKTFINNEPDRTAEWISYNISEITKMLIKGNFIQRSSSIFSNLAHSYKLECNAYILPILERWLEWINKGTPIINEQLESNENI